MKKEIILRDYQEDAVNKGVEAIEKFDNNSLIVSAQGCHEKGYNIQMYDGSLKAVEKIVCGDLVMGDDSTSRTVLQLFKGFEPFYRIRTTKNETFNVNENHVLHLEISSINTERYKKWDKHLNITVADYLKLPKHVQERYKLRKRGYDIEGTAPIPYLLGVWLGDGSSRGCQITNADKEIIEYLEKFAQENNLKFKKLKNKYLYSLIHNSEAFYKSGNGKRKKRCFNVFFNTLKHYNLLQNKHIPEHYFKSDRQTRLALLAGLLDTDGSYSMAGYDFGLSNETLFDDVIRLVRSLGYQAVKKYRKDCNGKTVYRTLITGDLIDIPCLIDRKKPKNRKQIKRSYIHGFKIEKIESKEYFGFQLDGNNLYIDGQGFVHHNSGKSLIIAGIADRTQKECLILQPSRELLAQNVEKLSYYVPEEEIGVYSASFKRKDIRKFTFATIQSVYKKPELFEHIGLALIDEAHGVNMKNGDAMYTSFLEAIGRPPTLGLTATPFRNMVASVRLESGDFLRTTTLKLINRVNSAKGKPKMWNRIVFNLNMCELIQQNYLMPLKYEIKTVIPHFKIPVNKSRSDFDLEAFEKLLTPYEATIVEDINEKRNTRNSVLVFCSSVNQAERLSLTLTRASVVSALTPTKEREQIVKDFKDGVLDVVFNVGTLTTGFDHPALDTIFMLRPTRSLNLYAQIGGRGSRLFEGKTECLFVDYSGTVEEMGKIEDIILRRDERNMWEIYANGQPMHGKPLFSTLTDKTGKTKSRIKLGGKSV